jgi:hypothetical protein
MVGRDMTSRGSFAERQDAAAQRQGRGNATAASRQRVEWSVEEEEGSAECDSATVATRVSHVPSMHPSMAGTLRSVACSEATIGAGDDTKYWDYAHRAAVKADLGHKCRECRRPFSAVGEPITERRGARVSLRYHAACFSGFADPRSQAESSHHAGRLAGTQLDAAPSAKAGSKMRTGQHFDRHLGVGKTGMGLGMGSNGFGVRSSRGAGASVAEEDLSGFDDVMPPPTEPVQEGSSDGGRCLTEAALAAHGNALADSRERSEG